MNLCSQNMGKISQFREVNYELWTQTHFTSKYSRAWCKFIKIFWSEFFFCSCFYVLGIRVEIHWTFLKVNACNGKIQKRKQTSFRSVSHNSWNHLEQNISLKCLVDTKHSVYIVWIWSLFYWCFPIFRLDKGACRILVNWQFLYLTPYSHDFTFNMITIQPKRW